MASEELQFHAFCLTDTGTRLDRYARAIARTVRQGDVVADVGAGTGILSFLACASGASRVYAIEAGEAIGYGELLASTTGFRDRVRFLNASSSQLSLPERVDVVVADIHDTFGLQSNGLATLLDARDRWLKPEGTLIPARLQLMVAPVDARDVYQKAIDVWQQHIQGVDVSPLRRLAVNQRHAARFQPEHFLGPPSPIGEVALTTTRELSVGGTTRVTANRSGAMHGLCGCFVTTLCEDIEIGNVPGASETTNFAQAFFPIEKPHAIREGDAISI